MLGAVDAPSRGGVARAISKGGEFGLVVDEVFKGAGSASEGGGTFEAEEGVVRKVGVVTEDGVSMAQPVGRRLITNGPGDGTSNFTEVISRTSAISFSFPAETADGYCRFEEMRVVLRRFRSRWEI